MINVISRTDENHLFLSCDCVSSVHIKFKSYTVNSEILMLHSKLEK